MADLKSTRTALTDALLELAEADDRIVLVCADSLGVMKGAPFKERFPDRVIDVGIAEQNAVACASGLASCGLIPFVVTYGVFITMRACEQVRSFVGYPKLNVKLVGANGGMAAGEREGVTHQAIEDLGIARLVPGMTVVAPADAGQTRKAIAAVAKIDGPCYVRIGSGRDPVVFDDNVDFELGKVRILREYGEDVALFANGVTLPRVLEASEQLRKDGIGAVVAEVHTIKPLDTSAVVEIVKRTGCAVTVEDHLVNGALGSAISECVAEEVPARIRRLGIRDVFPESGEPDELLDKYGIGVSDIVREAHAVAGRSQSVASSGKRG